MDNSQQFCLRFNNHQSTLVAVFDSLLENGSFVDCTLAAEGKCLNAHKVVLSACSPFFESLLSKHYDKHPILILKDVKFQELKAMMDYMYRGVVNIPEDQLDALLKAAESLQIKGLPKSENVEAFKNTASIPSPAPKSPPPLTLLPKVQDVTIEQRTKDNIREGSQSPRSRKKKRIRRKSDELDGHDESPRLQEFTEDPLQLPVVKEEIDTHTELMVVPKSEETNEDSIEDWTLDDDDEMSNMESIDDGAGPSHGDAGEGPSQDFGDWHVSNLSQEEVFLVSEEETAGAHHDSQDSTKSSKVNSNKRKPYSKNDLNSALEEVDNGIPLSVAGKKYGIPKTTLHSKVKSKIRIHAKKGPKPYLSVEEEDQIVKWICHLNDRGIILTRDQILDSVRDMINKLNRKTLFPDNRPGRHWYCLFLKRHPDVLRRVAQNTSLIVQKLDSEISLRHWLEKV